MNNKDNLWSLLALLAGGIIVAAFTAKPDEIEKQRAGSARKFRLLAGTENLIIEAPCPQEAVWLLKLRIRMRAWRDKLVPLSLVEAFQEGTLNCLVLNLEGTRVLGGEFGEGEFQKVVFREQAKAAFPRLSEAVLSRLPSAVSDQANNAL